MSIPVSVGVTGHRRLRQEDLPLLRQLVRGELQKLKDMCPNTEFVMVNSLAAGADCLCAEEALGLGYKLICPLPVEEEVYLRDFSPEELEVYQKLRNQAEDVFVAPATEEGTPERHFNFRQAGLYIANHCHVLLALWNGSDPKPGGCGTAEIVDYKLNGNTSEQERFICRDDGFVIHVVTPTTASVNAQKPEVRLLEPEKGSLEALLKETDSFNRDCAHMESKQKTLVDMPEKTSVFRRLERCYSNAAGMSGRFQEKYLHALRNLSLFCVLLVICYTLYDEADVMWMLICFGIILVLYYFIYRGILRGDYHKKYIRYRMLAESLRVQTYLSAAGISDNVANYYVWTQKTQTLWIRTAVASLTAGNTGKSIEPEKLCGSWLEYQHSYNKSAYAKNHSKDLLCDRISKLMLGCMIVLFVIVFLLEYAFPAVMQITLFGLPLRNCLKILWSSISAVTVFVSGYYGHLSYERKSADNKAMEKLFAEALKMCADRRYDINEVLKRLAREEIIENGNWASYCMENRPSFNL